MTDDDILAAARKAYREMGVKPITGRWCDPQKPSECVCLLTAAGRAHGEVISGFIWAEHFFEREYFWLRGSVDGWDERDSKYHYEGYREGYAFGLRCRVEFADLLGGNP